MLLSKKTNLKVTMTILGAQAIFKFHDSNLKHFEVIEERLQTTWITWSVM